MSDDQDAPRWYRLSLAVEGGSCRVAVLDTVDVSQPGVGARAASRLKDAEGIAVLPDGRVLASTEGDGRTRPIIQPGVFELDPHGRVVRRLPLPERFAQRPGKIPLGVRDNAAFECLTSSPDGRVLFTANEQPLLQDGRSPTFGRGALSRIIEYEAGPAGFTAAREYALPLEAIRHPGALRPDQADSGAVDLLAFDRTSLLLLERAFVRGRQDSQRQSFNDIIVSRLSLTEADDVAKVDSLDAPLIRPVRKEVLGRLSDVVEALPEWLRGLDNFEGIAAGPELPDGGRTVVLVSDDNFNARQRTAFVVLRLTD